MRLACATGTGEEAAAATEARAAFLETASKNPNAAAAVRKAVPDPARARNLRTLDLEFGIRPALAAQLEDILASIGGDFPELDDEDRLTLKAETLRLFTPRRQSGFALPADEARRAVAALFGAEFRPGGNGTAAIFARRSGAFHAVSALDPGTAHASFGYGAPSARAQELHDKILALYDDAETAALRYDELLESRRAAAPAKRVAAPG
jgi:hypothetical protein